MKTYKVSIIATVRNEAKDIERLIDSLLQQTYPFAEIVINDNGSQDNTVEIIKRYIARKNTRIRLVESGPLSIGEGRNAAIAASSGEIVALMDCGCHPRKDWLENVVRPLVENERLEIAWGNVVFDVKSRVIPTSVLSEALIFLTKFSEDRKKGKNLPSMAFKRRVWEQLGNFPEIPMPIEDLLTIDVLNGRGFLAVHVPEAVVYYYRYPNDIREVYQKWVVSATCAFFVRKSPSGFWFQLFLFSSFYLFLGLLVLNPLIGFLLFFCYIIFFVAVKFNNNRELGRTILSSPRKLALTLMVFGVLNAARFVGLLKACWLVLSGRKPPIKYYRNALNEKK